MIEGIIADAIIVGGGLSGCLTAWRIQQLAPGVRLKLLEIGNRLGGNHTWSFFETDLSHDENRWIAPLVAYSWPNYDVRFPNRRRTVATGYRSITSERLHEILAPAFGNAVTFGAHVSGIEAGDVLLSNGATVRAPCIIDARGAAENPNLALGYQKFLGQEVELEAPHGLPHPIIMDATVSQIDGYRFVYTLPFSPTRLLIEDTYYSDDQRLSADQSRERISRYASVQGWTIARIVREEAGVLPIILAGDMEHLFGAGRERGAQDRTGGVPLSPNHGLFVAGHRPPRGPAGPGVRVAGSRFERWRTLHRRRLRWRDLARAQLLPTIEPHDVPCRRCA
jgi:lycopene beta-cyclase